MLTHTRKGAILEASPLAKMPITGLETVTGRQGALHVIPDHQTREDEAINGNVTNIKYTAGFPRYPFVLMLDGIVSNPYPSSIPSRNHHISLNLSLKH